MQTPNSCDVTRMFSPDVPGSVPIRLRADELEGMWTLRFGMFGWAEKDMRGGVVKIEDGGRIFGGDSNYVYRGSLDGVGSELRGALTIDRHGADPEFKNSFGTNDNHYDVALTVEIVSRDRLEGYFHRDGHADVHLTMIRFVGN